ncbi:MAG: TolB family protein [Planctomycetaceae bacterium]
MIRPVPAASSRCRLGHPSNTPHRFRRFGIAFVAIITAFAGTYVHGDQPQASAPAVVQLTHDGHEKRDLAFRDANTLVYCATERATQYTLKTLDLSTGEIAPLHPDVTLHQFEPAFSPTGAHYAYIDCVGTLSLAVTIREWGSTKQASYKEDGFVGARSPCFTHDGQRVLYSLGKQGRQTIWSCDVNCEDRRAVIDSPGINNWPSVSPDGRTLVFSSSRDGNFEIYAADTDGGNVRRLTDDPRQDMRPRISPDGQHVAFTSNRDGNYEIYVIGFDGSAPRNINRNPERDDYPAWHPDGRLAYVAEREGRFDVILVELPDRE